MAEDEIAALEAKHARKIPARARRTRRWRRPSRIWFTAKPRRAEAIRASEIFFGGELTGISEATFNDIIGEVPTKEIEKHKLDGAGWPLVELLVHSSLCPSKGQARKDVEGGGVYVNNIRETNFQRALTANDLLFGKHLLLRKGKKNYVVATAK